MQGIDLSNAGMSAEKAKLQVIFVLGGPGSGKGTQVSPDIARCFILAVIILHHLLVSPCPAAPYRGVA